MATKQYVRYQRNIFDYLVQQYALLRIDPVAIVCWLLISIFVTKIIYHQYHLRSADKIELALGRAEIINRALLAYKRENGFYPTYHQGLNALIKSPRVGPQPKHWRRYLNQSPIDPWGNVYHYVLSNDHAYVVSYGISARPEGMVSPKAQQSGQANA